MDIGDRIKQRRKDLKLTQRQLGKLVGVTGSAISQMELGQTQHLLAKHALALAKTLNVSVEWLLTGEGQAQGVSEPRQGYGIDRLGSELTTKIMLLVFELLDRYKIDLPNDIVENVVEELYDHFSREYVEQGLPLDESKFTNVVEFALRRYNTGKSKDDDTQPPRSGSGEDNSRTGVRRG